MNKKIKFLIAFFVFLVLFLVAFLFFPNSSSKKDDRPKEKENTTLEQSSKLEKNKESEEVQQNIPKDENASIVPKEEKEVVEDGVYIYETSGFDENEKVGYLTLSDDQSPKIFSSIFENSTKKDGIFDLAEPHYFIEIFKDNKSTHSYFVWFNEDSSVNVSKKDATEQLFSLSESDAELLRSILK